MKYSKGQSGNPKGPVSGKIRNNSEELTEKITVFLNKSFSTVQKDFKNMPSKDRMKLYCDFLKYVIAKRQVGAMNDDDSSDEAIQLTKDNKMGNKD